MPHTDTLNTWIAEAAAERAKLDEWIAWCERGLELHADEAPVEPQPEVAAPRPAEKPRRPAVAREARPADRDLEGKVLAFVLNANQPVSRAAILAAFPGARDRTVDARIRALLDAGKITAEGKTAARRFRAGEHKAHSEARAKVETGAERNAAELQSKVALIGLRDRALKAVLADPGKLTTANIAQALNADENDIATVLEQLVEQGKIARGIQGRWARTAAAA